MTGPAGSPRPPGTVAMVWAQSRDGVIGADGGLPWHLPEDLAIFRRLTTGCTVVMGRRTWESLPARFRPLPGRTNVVLTTAPGWAAEGATTASSVDQVLAEHAPDHGGLWVIGGGTVYAAFLPHAHRLVVTEVDLDVPGDTRAPAIDRGWRRVSRVPEEGWSSSAASGLRYAVVEYARGPAGPAG